MEKKFDFVIILFIISAVLLFSSSYMFYLTLNRSIDFIDNIIECTGEVQEQSYVIPQSKKNPV